jgi:hypothetical protein
MIKGNIKHQQINGTPPFPGPLTMLGNHETSANSISVSLQKNIDT